MAVSVGRQLERDRAREELRGERAVFTPARLGIERSTSNLATWLSFVKPHIDVTFVLVTVTGSVLAGVRTGALSDVRVLDCAASVALLSAGAECWTNLLDRKIDSAMVRTAGRPLPTGRITVPAAAAAGVLLTAVGLALAALLGLFTFVFLALALIDNVIVYSALTKRATPWSIVLGAPVGSLVLWAGYAAVAEPISRAAWLLGGMVALWVPVHIWAIAIRYREDYARAAVPMAPVVWSQRRVAIASLVSSLAMGSLAVGGLVAIGGPATAWIAVPVGFVSILVALGAVVLPYRDRFAPNFIRLVTLYLVFVLFAAIGRST